MKKYYFGLQEKLVIDGKSVTKVSWGNGYETAEKAVIANAQRVSQSPLGSHWLLGYFDESIMKLHMVKIKTAKEKIEVWKLVSCESIPLGNNQWCSFYMQITNPKIYKEGYFVYSGMTDWHKTERQVKLNEIRKNFIRRNCTDTPGLYSYLSSVEGKISSDTATPVLNICYNDDNHEFVRIPLWKYIHSGIAECYIPKGAKYIQLQCGICICNKLYVKKITPIEECNLKKFKYYGRD